MVVFGAHFLVVQVKQRALTPRAEHMLRVHDQAVVLLKELLDGLDGLTIARPRVASKEIVAL